jgi:hypothetical protein
MRIYEIFYCGKRLLGGDANLIDQHYGCGENWADAYASESGLDRELCYDPAELEIVESFSC